MRRSLSALAAATLLLLSACDAPRSTDPEAAPTPDAPTAELILDGANGWNPYAFILAPVGNDPAPGEVGVFDGDVEPTVELCRPAPGTTMCDPGTVLTLSGSTAPARWTVDDGPGNDVITVDDVDEVYQTQIRLGLFDLEVGVVYRLQVRVDQNLLAAADLMVTGGNGNGNGNGRGRGNSGGGSSVTVPANTYAVSSTNRTIPFQFRLDDGALCWDAANPTVIQCTSRTIEAGEPDVVVLETSTGGEVVFDLPSGWIGDVDQEGGVVDDITLVIEEVEVSQAGGETTCFTSYQLGDPQFGNPERCFDVRADTDNYTDVDVDFQQATPPVLAFCPDPDVLAAIQGGNDNFLMTSIQQDASGEVARVYPNIAPPSSFQGCSAQIASAGPIGRFFASAWDRVLRPAVSPLLPQPLSATRARADLGFGGQILRLSTIFFWSRFPESIALTPAADTLIENGATLQLTVDEIFHHGPPPTPGSIVNVTWGTTDANVATVDAAGVVTPVGVGTATITATATNIKGFDDQFMSASAVITVEAAPAFAADVNTVLPGTTVASGYGQTLVVQGSGFPAGAGLRVDQGGQTFDAFVFGSDGANIWARLSDGVNSANAGPADLYVLDGTGAIASDPFAITVSTTPATPQLVDVLDGSSSPTTTFASGDAIRIGARGTDTSGAEILFTQGAVTTVVPVTTTSGSATPYAWASWATVPALVDGPATVQIRTTVNGVTSTPSNTVAITIQNPSSVVVNFSSMLAGTSGNPNFADCPSGQAGVGLRGTAVEWYGWANFNGVQMGCRALDTNGDPTGPVTWVGGFGNGGGSITNSVPFSETCSAGLMVDLQAGINGQGHVASIEAGCYDFAQIFGQQVGSVPTVAGFTVVSPSGSGVATTQSGTCTPGHVATGLGVNEGNVLDGIGFRCSPIQDVLPPGGAQ